MAASSNNASAGPQGDGSEGQDERRKAPRFTLLIQTAKLISSRSEFLCVVRDASTDGVRIRHFGHLPDERFLEFELANGEGFPVELVWQDEEHAGLKFPDEVDLARIVKLSNGSMPKRRLRLRTVIEGTLSFGGLTCHVAVRNISQQGAGIECRDKLAIEQLVKLETDELEPIFAKVCWRDGIEYGIVFEETLSYMRLAKIVAGTKVFDRSDAQAQQQEQESEPAPAPAGDDA
jgi:hypothetical protein